MPRESRTGRRTVEPTLLPSNSMVASATRYQGKVERIYRPLQDWQRDCYRHYGICGEARFAARFLGHALSRATLHIGKRDREGKITRQTTGTADAYLRQLFNGAVGQSQMLESIGVHLVIAGECFLVGRKTGGLDTWEVVSPLEMMVNGIGSNASWSIDYGDDKPPVPVGENDVVIRVWLPDPAKRIEADSPFKSMLPVLDEIEWATRHIFSQLSSRLAGAGILLFPTEATFAPPPTQTTDGETKAATHVDEVTGIMKMLADAMLIPLRDPSNPAAKIPIVGKMPGEHIDKVKLLHFWSNVDEKAMSVRRDALSRFADGMDAPREQIAGMSSNPGTGGGRSAGVSHWGAWQIEESTIKMHVEPMLEVVVNALTLAYISPLVNNDPNTLVIYDTSALRLRPDRSQEAITLNAAGLIKDDVAARENGFGPDDMMNDDDLKRFILRKLATGSATPEMMIAALQSLNVALPIAAPTTPGTNVREARPAPTQENIESRPRTPLEAAALPLVIRALERAGNRIRQDIKKSGAPLPEAPAFAMHTVHTVNGTASAYLIDAWSTAPMVLAGLGDVDKIVASLDTYCRKIMTAGVPLDPDDLAKHLEATC